MHRVHSAYILYEQGLYEYKCGKTMGEVLFVSYSVRLLELLVVGETN